MTSSRLYKYKISIIIPVYNVEKYIGRCLKSCINQSDSTLGMDYEIIIVNDGTPDRSAEIAKNIIDGISGCTIINQENRGLGGARNTGVRHSSGEYIWFIDSDDWIAPNSISVLCSAINKTQHPDVIMFRAADVIKNEYRIRQKESKSISILQTGITVFCQGGLQTCAPFQIIKRTILIENNLFFIEKLFHEDNEFMPRLAYFADRVISLNDLLYFVYHNPNSITRSNNPQKAYDLIKVCNKLDLFIKQHHLDALSASRYSAFISTSLNNAFHEMSKQSGGQINEFNIEIKNNNHLLSHYIKSRSPQYIIEYILFRVSNNYTGVYSLFRKIKSLLCSRKISKPCRV